MFVVRRAFRNHNKMITPGSIVEPGEIKWFKTRLRDRLIIEVTEQSLDKWEEYFKEKHKVSIKANLKEKASKLEVKPVVTKTTSGPTPVAAGTKTNVEKPKATGTVKPKVVVAK